MTTASQVAKRLFHTPAPTTTPTPTPTDVCYPLPTWPEVLSEPIECYTTTPMNPPSGESVRSNVGEFPSKGKCDKHFIVDFEPV